MAQYEILRSLDRGGMAEVFLARLVGVEGFEKRVVLKRVLPHLSSDARFLARFVDEARVAARLSHPNIVQIFELGEQHGQYFIAMEHVEGRNLKDVAKRLFARGAGVPVEHAVRIGQAVLDALHYAHTRTDDEGRPVDLVHRDVSPSNILVSFDGAVKLIDFGIARHTERVECTNPGTVVGKAGYMAPEQMRGQRVDARADLFSCAATLFHLITRTLPFPGAGAVAVMDAVHRGERRPYDEVRDVIDEELFGVLAKGMAHDPAERFQSAREMQLALEGYASARGVMASSAALSELMRATFAEGDDDDADVHDPETQSRVVTLAHGGFPQLPSSDAPSALHIPVTRTAEAPRSSSAWVSVLVAVLLMAALGGGVAWLAVGARGEEAGAAPVARAEPVARAPVPSEPGPAERAPAPVDEEPGEGSESPLEREPGSEEARQSTKEPPQESAEASAEERALAAVDATLPPAAPRRRPQPRRVSPKRAPATLTLDSDPWSEVVINGRRVGLTPVHALELPAGRHTLRLVNPEQQLEKRLTLTLRAGESRRLRVQLEPLRVDTEP